MKKQPKKVTLSDVSSSFLGGYRNVILSKKETAGDVYLVEMLLPQGSGVAVHIHDFEDEIFHVLVGEVTLTLGENTVHAQAGDILYLPKGIPHGIHCSGAETAKVLNYVIPGENFEEFFAQMHLIGLDATQEEKATIGVKHGIRFI